MPPATDPADAPPAPSRRRRRLRLSVGVAMLLVLAVAIGLAAWDYSQRIRIVFANQTSAPATSAKVEIDGRSIELGPIAPSATAQVRIKPVAAEMMDFRCQLDVGRLKEMGLGVPTSTLRPGCLVEVDISSVHSMAVKVDGKRKMGMTSLSDAFR